MTQLGTGGEDLMMNALGIGGGYGTQGTPPSAGVVPTGDRAGFVQQGIQAQDQAAAAAQAAADKEAEKIKAWRGEQNRQGRASTILGGRKVYMGGGVGTSARRTLLPV